MSAPVHVVPDAPGHGVAEYARQVASAVGARVVDVEAARTLAPQPVHVHVTERLFGATCEEAAAVLVDLGARHRMTVTLHDVPQPGDGTAFERRARAYAAVLDVAAGWTVCSHHEAALVARHVSPASTGGVVPLPVVPPLPPLPLAGATARSGSGSAVVVGVLGWVYPGKGHLEVLRACARLDGPVVVRALGRTAVGHDDLADELATAAAGLGVGWEITGWVPDADLPDALDAVDVPVAAHRNVSASGSINTWLAGRRRPLVADGAYAREMARLRPGTLTLVDVAPEPLATAVAHSLAAPASTRLPPEASTGPGLPEVAAAYLDWWATT